MFVVLGDGVSCENSEVSENSSEAEDDEEEFDDLLDLLLSEMFVFKLFLEPSAPDETISLEFKSAATFCSCLVSLFLVMFNGVVFLVWFKFDNVLGNSQILLITIK